MALPKTFVSVITTSLLVALFVWIATQILFMMSYYTYAIIGQYITAILFNLAFWPNWLVRPFYPTDIPDWYYSVAWPISVVISGIGWFLLTLGIFFISYMVGVLKKKLPGKWL